MNLTTPFCCPRCRVTLGYLQDGKLHVEINGRTFLLDGFIKLTCAHPCNHRWKYRPEAATTQPPTALLSAIA